MEHQDEKPSRPSPMPVPRTRSQASPQWAAQHVLILVNEIAAIEADCSNALSSFQKWKLIVQNCNALGVPHSSNQCRRKWNLVLQDYKKIKHWASQSVLYNSYWSLAVQTRNEFGLPEHFDKDLFKAIDDVVRLLDDTDHDSDPEAQDDMLEVIADLGPKKQRRKLMALRSHAEMKSHKRSRSGSVVEKPKKIHVVEQPPHESCVVEKLRRSKAEEISWRIEAEENVERSQEEEMKHSFSSESEEIMVARLGENAEQIQAIVEETFTDNGCADLKNVEDFRTDFARRQGDKLIACLRDILSTLSQFSELGQQ